LVFIFPERFDLLVILDFVAKTVVDHHVLAVDAPAIIGAFYAGQVALAIHFLALGLLAIAAPYIIRIL